jgi:hypothetical protein
LLIQELALIDKQAEDRDLSQGEWIHRYHYQVERQLENVYLIEEFYWKQRMGKNWLVANDSSTKFLHHFANSRRWKSTIIQLESDQGIITD